MAPPSTAVVRSGWLTDPLTDGIGPATVALVLHLAARASSAAPAGAAITIAPAEWLAFLDTAAAARVLAAGLVEVLPTEAGGLAGFRVGDWLRRQIDTEDAVSHRIRSRERMRRLRMRRAGSEPTQLPLWLAERAAEGESKPARQTKDLAAKLSMCKSCGRSADVTSDVTDFESGALYPRARTRPNVRTTYEVAASGTKAAKSTKQQTSGGAAADGIGASAPPAFRLLLALVARTRRARWSWRYPMTGTDRRELLNAVRTDLVRAHLPTPADREIKRAIRIDECNDVSYRAAAGQIGGTR